MIGPYYNNLQKINLYWMNMLRIPFWFSFVDAAEDDVGGMAEDVRTEHGERDAGDGEHDDRDEPQSLGSHARQQPSRRCAERSGACVRCP